MGSSDAEAIRVIIEPPLAIPAGTVTDEAAQEAARQFGARLEHYVRRYPAEWRDWKNLVHTDK